MPHKRNQIEERVYTVFKDQHGRLWETMWDKVGQGTVGPKNPKGWKAPILPPEYMLAEHEDRPRTFTINYSRWLSENAAGWKRYEDECRIWGERMEKDPDDPKVKKMVGRPPMPPKMIRAAMSGTNKWVLGMVPMAQVPAWAEEFRYVFERHPSMPPEVFADVETEFPDAAPVKSAVAEKPKVSHKKKIERTPVEDMEIDVEALEAIEV